MSNIDSTTVAATIPKELRKVAEKRAQQLGYVSLSDFIRAAIRDKLANPRGEPVGASLPQGPPKDLAKENRGARKP